MTVKVVDCELKPLSLVTAWDNDFSSVMELSGDFRYICKRERHTDVWFYGTERRMSGCTAPVWTLALVIVVKPDKSKLGNGYR